MGSVDEIIEQTITLLNEDGPKMFLPHEDAFVKVELDGKKLDVTVRMYLPPGVDYDCIFAEYMENCDE